MSAWVQILVAATAAATAAFFSFLQWRLAQNKLKLDLFDRRHAVFRAVGEHLSRIAQTGGVERGQVEQFLKETRDAAFLFDRGMTDHLATIYKLMVALETHASRPRLSDERGEAEEGMHIKKELRRHLKALPERFAPFLFLRHEVLPHWRWPDLKPRQRDSAKDDP
ncbi:hypothetical protein STAQ_28000 [Allostella sp. ATCC 35155]|nr:hypothetical protein STAQ_28000 [Stella sp. ATCC 35155]